MELSPALQAALDAYTQAPTEANLDALVRALSQEQVGHAQATLEAARARLGQDPWQWVGLVAAAVEAQQLSRLVLGGHGALAQMQASFPEVQRLAAITAPGAWAEVSLDALISDPAAFDRFLADADSAFRSGQDPRIASHTAPPPALVDLRSGRELFAGLPPGTTVDGAIRAAEIRLLRIKADHPEFAVLNPQELVEAFVPEGSRPGLFFQMSGGQLQIRGTLITPSGLDICDSANGRYTFAHQLGDSSSQIEAFSNTLDRSISELAALQERLRTERPQARDLLPMAEQVLPLLGEQLKHAPSPAGRRAFEEAFRMVQGYQQAQSRRMMMETGLLALGIAASIGATTATGGMAAALFATSILASSAQAGLTIDGYLDAQRLSRYRGGGVDLSGVPPPDGTLLGLELALLAVGVVMDVRGLARALDLDLSLGRVIRAGSRFSSQTTPEVLAEFTNPRLSFDALSSETRVQLAEYGIRSPDYWVSRGMTRAQAEVTSNRLLNIFRATHLQDIPLRVAFENGSISARDVYLWNAFRRSSVQDMLQSVLSVSRNFEPSMAWESQLLGREVFIRGGMPLNPTSAPTASGDSGRSLWWAEGGDQNAFSNAMSGAQRFAVDERDIYVYIFKPGVSMETLRAEGIISIHNDVVKVNNLARFRELIDYDLMEELGYIGPNETW